MSKRSASCVSYEDAIRDILDFVDNDKHEELEPLVDDEEESDNELELQRESEEEFVEEQDEAVPRRHRKLLTRNRLVCDIDSALNRDNYDQIHYINGEGQWETLTGYLGPKSKDNTEKITWTSVLPEANGRQRRCDVITGNVSCLKGIAKNVSTYQDCFDLFFDQSMFELITSMTNIRINEHLDVLRQNKEHMFNSSKYTWLKETTIIEIRALVGLMYLRGLYGLNHHDIELLFTDSIGPNVFGATMSQQRMKFLLAHITFDKREDRAELWPTDRFAAARNIFEAFNQNCSKYVIPSEFLAIDETLYPMRHQIAFRQYNPNKPHRYGMLIKSLNDSRFPFTYKAAPYAGKPQQGDGPYYISATEDYVKYLVNETEKDTSLQGRNISTDRLYTSIPLANWLLDRNITTVGTLNTNRIGLPNELKDTKCREEFSVTCHVESEEKNMYLTTYAVKTKSTGRKNVFMLSTMRPMGGITKDDQKFKPAIFKFYDFTKGGTDIVDQLNDYYTCRSGTNRWDLVALFYMLDTARVNCKTVWCLKNKLKTQDVNAFKFGWKLGNQLIRPAIESRGLNGLGSSVLQKMVAVLGKELVQPQQTHGKEKRYPLQGDIKRRCKNCEKGITKAEKANLLSQRSSVNRVE